MLTELKAECAECLRTVKSQAGYRRTHLESTSCSVASEAFYPLAPPSPTEIRNDSPSEDPSAANNLVAQEMQQQELAFTTPDLSGVRASCKPAAPGGDDQSEPPSP